MVVHALNMYQTSSIDEAIVINLLSIKFKITMLKDNIQWTYLLHIFSLSGEYKNVFGSRELFPFLVQQFPRRFVPPILIGQGNVGFSQSQTSIELAPKDEPSSSLFFCFKLWPRQTGRQIDSKTLNHLLEVYCFFLK